LKDTLQENPYICFDLNYLYALLNEGYSIPDESNLYLAKKIKGLIFFYFFFFVNYHQGKKISTTNTKL